MPIPILPIVAGASFVGGELLKKTAQQRIMSAASRFATSPFGYGAMYSLGTFVGFPGNYRDKSSNSKQTTLNVMPYGYYRRPRYTRYSRFRRYRRYSRYY